MSSQPEPDVARQRRTLIDNRAFTGLPRMSAWLLAPRRRLPLLLAITLLVRGLVAFLAWKTGGSTAFYRADTLQYVNPAQSLLNGSYSADGRADVFRTPGYPLLLLPALAMHQLVLVGIAENFLLTAASALLVWKVTLRLLPGSSASTWAVLLFCFEPIGLLYSETLMSDTAFTTFVLLFVWLLLRFFDAPSYRQLLLLAAVLAFATYIRPVSLYLGIWLLPVFLLFLRTLSWRQRTAMAILFNVVFAAMIVPWAIRNAVVEDYFGFSTAQEYTVYFVTAAAVDAQANHRGSYSAIEAAFAGTTYYKVHPEQGTWSEGQKARYWRSEAISVIVHHLPTFFVFYARGCLAILFDPAVTEALRETGLYPSLASELPQHLDQGYVSAALWLFRQYPLSILLIPIMLIQLLLYYMLAVVGVRRIPLKPAVVIVAIAAYCVLTTGFVSIGARYRDPVMPLVCVTAGVAIATRNRRTVKSERAPSG